MKSQSRLGKAFLLFVVFANILVNAYVVVPKEQLNTSKINDTIEKKSYYLHGLDYQYEDDTLWETQLKDNSSYLWLDSEEYSDEENYDDSDYDHDRVITIGDTKDATTKPSEDKNDNVVSLKVVSSSTEAPRKKAVRKLSEDKNENSEYSWDETPGDEDDGLSKEEGVSKSTIANLPSDNDPDADKYLDPDRYSGKLELHRIEDSLMRRWTVVYPDTNLPCIMLKGNIQLIVPLNPSEFNKDFLEIDVPNDAEAFGTCLSIKKDYQEITLKWNVTIAETQKTYVNKVSFGFASNWTSEYSRKNIPADQYALTSITATYFGGEIEEVLEEVGDGLYSYNANDLVEFLTPINQSMSCFYNKQLILGSMQLTLSNLQFEAFRSNLETLPIDEFSTSVLCSLDEEYVFDAVLTFIIWFWIGALVVVLVIFLVLLALGYRKRHNAEGGFNYKILNA